MLPIIAYIIGCFLGGLSLKDSASRRPHWILLGSCVLLCALYLTADQSPLPGFSISSLSVGKTRDAEPRWIAPKAPVPAPSTDSTIARAFMKAERLDDSVIAKVFGWTLYLLGAAAILMQPRYGLYLMLFFALLGDALLLPWYPFVKGFSSRESLFFIHDALIISPLELYVVLTAISWTARHLWRSDLHFYSGRFFWPGLAFLICLVFGLAYGIATGGDLRIALWEARAVFYLVPLILLTTQLIEEPAHVTSVLSIALAAVFIKGVYASLHYLLVLQGDLTGIESLTEHGAAIHVNTLFVASLVVWIYKSSPMKRMLLPLTIPFVLLGYIAMQRRSAFITLAFACGLVLAVLFRRHRRLFWRIAPAFVLLSALYLAVGWNSQSMLARPAQAIKSVYADHLASDRDQSSNNYRVRENRNINATIHQHPFTGIGFGQKFLMIDPLPDINFEWKEYITHNSILWMWMKTGIAGFFFMLCLFGLAVMSGVRALDDSPRDDVKVVLLTATLYLVMHFIYACVDMSWDAASMVYVATMMGIVNRALVDRDSTSMTRSPQAEG